MQVKTKSYKAKRTPIKIAVAENEITFKDLAVATNTAYQTIIQITAGSQNTSALRANAIAKELNKNVEDLFEQVR